MKASSLIDLKKAGATAELSAREAEFNALQEAKHEEATARIEAELAQGKLKLEQLEAKKQIEIARAKLKAYQEVEGFDDEMDSVEDDRLDISLIQADLDTEAASLLPPQERSHSASDRDIPNSNMHTANQPQDVHQFPVEGETTHPVYAKPQASTANVDTITLIVTAIADSLSSKSPPST